MSLIWKRFKKTPVRERLRCTNCDSIAMEVRAEPVARKRHTRTGNRKRTIARCLSCRSSKVLAYGGRTPN
jgi:hypothetical protein